MFKDLVLKNPDVKDDMFYVRQGLVLLRQRTHTYTQWALTKKHTKNNCCNAAFMCPHKPRNLTHTFSTTPLKGWHFPIAVFHFPFVAFFSSFQLSARLVPSLTPSCWARQVGTLGRDVEAHRQTASYTRPP